MKTKFSGILTLLLALVMQTTFAQEKIISGTVSDDLGLPLPGATVLIKGSKSGTSTDFDGKYTISAKQGATLVFSFVGYTAKEVKVGTSNTVNVQMAEDAQALDEVVITGVAGAISRNKLSVTVNKVSEKDLLDIPTTSAESVLQGKVAGVSVTNFGQPGQGANIQLRGANNFFGSQTPLIIVDGVFVEGGLQDVSSDDIASIEVVKGASASALYGSRAGNGVIVISTKKGKTGIVSISLKSEIGFSTLNNFVDTNNSHHYKLASDWEGAKGRFTKYEGLTYPANYNNIDYSHIQGTRIESDDHYADNPYGILYNPQKQFFKTGTTSNLYVSAAAGSEKSNVFFSAEKSEAEGVLKETNGYERVATRLNATYKITDWLTFDAYNNFVRTNDQAPGGTGDIFFDLLVSQPDTDLRANNLNGQPYLLVPSRFFPTSTNPMYPLWSNSQKETINKFLGSYKLNLEFTDYLNFDAEYAIETYDSKYSDFSSNKNLTTGGSLATLFSQNQVGYYSLTHEKNTSQKAQFTLNYQKRFGDLNISSKLSYLMEDSDFEEFYGSGSKQIYSGESVSLDNYENTFIGSDESSVNARNAFGIVGLDYKDRYIVDAMYRVDGSSTFGENEKWNDYFRVSGAYRISKDLNIDNINEMKFHVAYGTAGQRPGYDWQYRKKIIKEGVLGRSIAANPDLKPSETSELEFGFSTKLFNRINFEAVYSKSKTDDQFMLVDLFPPLSGGYDKQWVNAGTLEFKTFEMSLGAEIFKDGDFKWNTNLVFDTSSNEVTKLNVAPQTVGPNSDDGTATTVNYAGQVFRIEEGIEHGTMWGYQFVTNLSQMAEQLPTGASINDYVINRDGIVVEANTIGTSLEKPIDLIDEDGQKVLGDIGNANADFKIGFRNDFSYKNFGLYMLVDWKQGGDIYNRNAQWLTRDYRHEMIDQSGYSPSEKKTVDYYQGLYAVNQDYKFWVEDGTYVKLREVSLFYTLQKDQLSQVAKGFFDSIRIGLTGTNLLTFSDYSGWDPEVQLYDSNTKQYFSVDQNSYPVTSSYKLSILFKF
ncbi:SusC/RagA family TonB-linked outer membrane protein [Mariniflexile ostreae]|uniref:SusC/RagA family TonB-linked outer membrane protein n=1 Tax=Mariniflexile ostreae TaxID=1520892 RepID=A0ABV5FAG1_9FLAO